EVSSAGKSLSATLRLRRGSSASHTSPIPPAPSGERISYRPMCVPVVIVISSPPLPSSSPRCTASWPELPPGGSRESVGRRAMRHKRCCRRNRWLSAARDQREDWEHPLQNSPQVLSQPTSTCRPRKCRRSPVRRSARSQNFLHCSRSATCYPKQERFAHKPRSVPDRPTDTQQNVRPARNALCLR